jgi:CheY-like chemotaxis protein
MDAQQGYLLVVEDIPDILNLLEATLTFKGYRVVTARDGQEAMEFIQKEHPAMVITDILMPRMDGFSLVHRLRIDPETRSIPVVFLSATYVAPEDKKFALNIGVTRFMEKPVNLDEFLPAIAELLKHGVAATFEPLSEPDFYEGYRVRLEIKLDQKIAQTARAQNLLKVLPEKDKPAANASLQRTIDEREEIQLLLGQINERLNSLDQNKDCA